MWVGLSLMVILVMSCGDTNITIPGCEDCPERCLQDDKARPRCVTCLRDEQCRNEDSPTRKCNPKNECVCGSDQDCPEGNRCSVDKGCVQCLTDEHCTSSDRPFCSLDNTCVICTPGATEGCIPKGSGGCIPGTKVCKSSGRWGECENWKACETGETCVEKKCVVSCPKAPCQEGDRECTTTAQAVPGRYRTCVKTADGCLAWSQEDSSCGPKELCRAAKCEPVGCPEPPLCQLGETRCVDATATETCVKDPEGCASWGMKESCPADQACRTSLKKCTPCEPGETKACYTGDAKTKGIGECKEGVSTCLPDGSGFGACANEVKPAPERCANQKDDDCDGQIDESDGRALQFNGGTDQLSLGNAPVFALGSSFTVELWLKFDGLGNRPIALLLNKHRALDNDNGYHFKIQNEQGTPTFGFSWWNRGGGNQLLFGACPVGRWVHIAFVYDSTSTTYRFFLDGKQTKQGTMSLTIRTNAFPLLFGNETPPASGSVTDVKFRGQLGAFRLSSSARYNAAFTPPCTWSTDNTTTGLWNLEDGTGATAKDHSTSGNDGVITGALWVKGRSCNAASGGGCQ